MKDIIQNKNNKKELFDCRNLKFSGIPVQFAGAGPQKVKLRWILTGIAKDKKFGIDQTMWVPYEQLPQDFVDEVKKVCKVKEEKTVEVDSVDIDFFQG